MGRGGSTYDRGMARALPKNPDVAAQFDLLADLLEIEGADAFRVVAYRRAANRIRETSGPVAQLALEGRAKELSGIGKTIEEKIVQIVDHGEIDALAKRRATIPEGVVQFMRLPGLGPKTAARIWRELGVSTLDELKSAAETQRVRTLPGLGAKAEERILKALAAGAEAPREHRPLLGQGLPAVLAVRDTLAASALVDKISEAGSVRRRRETFRDLDLIATSSDPATLTDAFTRLPWVVEVAAHGDTKATVVSNDGLRFDLRVVPPESYGNLLQHFTGSKDHNVALRERAVKQGLSVSEYSITVVETGEELRHASEEAVYERLGYQWIPPELRENAGELEAARKGELPVLVEQSGVKGDLHLHSTWSDGKATLEEMAVGAAARGYEYMAITDHSHRLRDGRLEQQEVEVAALNERLAPFRILRGVEVNIRADGSVDMSEEELATRDWVVASLHSSFDRSPTERVLAAMEHPYVDCIGHPTTRKINRRGPADLDVGRVIAKALDTGTFLEINGQPDRLDLRDAHARAAGEAGLKILVSSDGHSTGALAYLDLAVSQARRAWLTSDQVLNTRTWAEVAKLRKPRP
jgi:DNA polymerase (family 10)